MISFLDGPYTLTGFEADGQLFQFTSIPFGITNGVSAFQRVMTKIIRDAGLTNTWAYMDNVTIGGVTQEEHDLNVQKFYELVKRFGLTLNLEKSIVSVPKINMLGYLVSHLTLKPDPDRMKPLVNLPIPTDASSLKRAVGLFSYYSQWVERFSDKIKPLTQNLKFPLSEAAESSFEELKNDIANSSLACPNNHDLLVIETDASDVALSATLNQCGRPVAFFSRTLLPHEQRHPPIEKEAAAIIESCRKWRHYLCNKRFKVVTDQEAVSFIFDTSKHGKTKNHKLERWRIELSCLHFDIQYRPGPMNPAADCLSRVVISSVSSTLGSLKNLHDGLAHPGSGRLYNFVRSRNLPYSMEDVKQVISKCQICARIKPQFYRPQNPPLIKATQALERLAVDFKGPLPSVNQNKYLLTVVDEYSRYPWAFPCKEMTAKTVIDCLDEIFTWCGHAGFIHSDNGPAFISKELDQHLMRQGIGHSFSSAYNPRGNGQVERYNQTIWKGIQLSLASEGLESKHWESTLRTVLHSIRSLVCTSTNQSPHERMFRFERRTMTGHALPSWLVNQNRALVRKQVRQSKYDDWVEECDIIHVTPSYAQIRTEAGKEQTVSLRDLAPLPAQDNIIHGDITPQVEECNVDPSQPNSSKQIPQIHQSQDSQLIPNTVHKSVPQPETTVLPKSSPPVPSPSYSEGMIRRSTRSRTEPNKLNYSELGGSNSVFGNFMNIFE